MAKTTEFNSCTILRTFKRTEYTINVSTGERKFIKEEVVTEPCNIPLFSKDNRVTGVCRCCHEGWETEDNVFASDEWKANAASPKGWK